MDHCRRIPEDKQSRMEAERVVNNENAARPAPSDPHGGPDLPTIDEVAALTRMPPATLRYWRQCHMGPRSLKLGRRVLHQRGDVIDWIARQEFATAVSK